VQQGLFVRHLPAIAERQRDSAALPRNVRGISRLQPAVGQRPGEATHQAAPLVPVFYAALYELVAALCEDRNVNPAGRHMAFAACVDEAQLRRGRGSP
jgi:hypothetical protein